MVPGQYALAVAIRLENDPVLLAVYLQCRRE